MTTFDLVSSRKRTGRIWHFFEILDPACALPTRNEVKSGQNWPKFKNSENWEKMQFFHVSTTFVALELVVTAQIENKWILSLLSIGSNSLVFSSLKKALFSKHFKISFWRIASKTGWKISFGDRHHMAEVIWFITRILSTTRALNSHGALRTSVYKN